LLDILLVALGTLLVGAFVTMPVAGRAGVWILVLLTPAGLVVLLAVAVLAVVVVVVSLRRPGGRRRALVAAGARVVDLVDSGELGDPGAWDLYDGSELPWRLRLLSVTGRVTAIGRYDAPPGSPLEPPVLLLPQLLGIPDGGAGYVHLPDERRHLEQFDGFSDPIEPWLRLADGWWFAS
jgi:hypothetical protein